ncbi:MAG: cytochrome b [Magnetococcales bacterium]|nr:cytochrome b [Magnetococcales bacterium]
MNDRVNERFDPIARLLHWSMAFLLIGMIGLGFYATSLDFYDPLYHRALHWHRSFGIVLLLLALLRLAWRLRHPAPSWPAGMPLWEQKAALLAHAALYGLMFLLPITGYLTSTADGHAIRFFDWFAIPALIPLAKGMETLLGNLHLLLAILFVGLLLMHIAAALKHQWLDRDGILRRMW